MHLKEIRPEVARQTHKAWSMSEVCGPETILKICLFNFFVYTYLSNYFYLYLPVHLVIIFGHSPIF